MIIFRARACLWTLALAACPLCTTATADIVGDTAAEMLEKCDLRAAESATLADPAPLLDATGCLHYVSGVYDAMQVTFFLVDRGLGIEDKPEGIARRLNICLPPGGLSAEVQQSVVRSFLSDNPEALNATPRVAVVSAFVRTFPCKPPE